MRKSPRDLIDPNSTLPQVELQQRDSSVEHPGFLRERLKIVAGELAIGQCDIVTLTDPKEQRVAFDGVEIDEVMRGKGFGLATYLQAIELAHSRGLPFETQEYGQSEYAKKIWETLADKGVAEVTTPFKLTKTSGGKDIYTGKFSVAPTSGLKVRK